MHPFLGQQLQQRHRVGREHHGGLPASLTVRGDRGLRLQQLEVVEVGIGRVAALEGPQHPAGDVDQDIQSTEFSFEPFDAIVIATYKIINLNDIINNMEKMLGRLIGEHIALRLDLADDIGLEKVLFDTSAPVDLEAMLQGQDLLGDFAQPTLPPAEVSDEPGEDATAAPTAGPTTEPPASPTRAATTEPAATLPTSLLACHNSSAFPADSATRTLTAWFSLNTPTAFSIW